MCHRLMTHLLILVVESVKLADGQIAIIDPPLGKVCSRACLRAWAARQDEGESGGGSGPQSRTE